MRTPRLIAVLLLLTSASLSAQGMEYRVRMHMSMPGMPDGSMPTPEMTMLVQGTKMRVDNSTRGMEMSIILDGSGKSYFVNHADKTYREQAALSHIDGQKVPTDTAQLRAMGLIPDVITTTDHRTILGYETTRYIMVMRLPVPGQPGHAMFSINESWITNDPVLKEAFNNSIAAAERMLGPAAGDMKALMPPGAQGIPLESNIMMLKGAATNQIDALALLKEDSPPGLMSRVRMETLAINARAVPDSVFVVPADYKKSN
jgi:hypothetical protein